MTIRCRLLFAGAVVALIALSGCTININMPGTLPGGGSGPGGMQTSSPYTAQEVMFADMMIPHHQQAIDMADMAFDRSSNLDILDLAERIRDGQAPEIEQMKLWLAESGGIRAGAHHGHGDSMGGQQSDHMMGGMATEEEMAALGRLSSPEFDTVFLELMIAHHEGAVNMVLMISRSTNADVKKLADDIIRIQREEISEMRTLLETL